MNKLRLAATAGLLLAFCALPALAFNPACFCTRKNPTSQIQQYQVVRFASRACENERYTPSGGTPWDDGIKQCVTSGAPATQPAASSAQLVRRCFCARRAEASGQQQFRVFGMEIPGCKNAAYKENGIAWFDRVLPCDAWNNCHKADVQCQAKLNQLTLNIAANPMNAVRTSSALQAQSVKCQSIIDDCWVKGLK
jgi:hypothetical protein